MNKKRLLSLGAAALISVTALTILVHGNEKTYDPENDPLISLSYLNGVFAPTYDAKIEALNTKLEALESTVLLLQNQNMTLSERITALESGVSDDAVTDPKPETPEEPTMEGYEVVYLTQGEKLLAETPCEIILRSGTAITVSITSNGVNDITDGTELLNAQDVPLYHLLLVPRGGDGRGIQITSADAYVMVRGDYQIVK